MFEAGPSVFGSLQYKAGGPDADGWWRGHRRGDTQSLGPRAASRPHGPPAGGMLFPKGLLSLIAQNIPWADKPWAFEAAFR